jgi:hypothetical protein
MLRDDPERLPSVGTLRTIRWPLQPRPRDCRVACASMTTAGWHSHATLGLCRSCTVWRRSPTRESSLRSEGSPTCDRRRFLRARPPFTPAATLFGALRVSLFEARRRLPTSATACLTCGHLPELSILAGREASTSILFSTRHALSLAEAVDVRRAALRPMPPTPVSVPPACAGLPDRDTDDFAPPPSACAGEVQ